MATRDMLRVSEMFQLYSPLLSRPAWLVKSKKLFPVPQEPSAQGVSAFLQPPMFVMQRRWSLASSKRKV